MITTIRVSLLNFIYYCKKPVTGCLGRLSQNECFITVIKLQIWFILSSGTHVNWLQVENNRLNTDLLTTRISQIPIAFRHTEIPCLHPAVSSLGACPTPAL